MFLIMNIKRIILTCVERLKLVDQFQLISSTLHENITESPEVRMRTKQADHQSNLVKKKKKKNSTNGEAPSLGSKIPYKFLNV